MRPTSGEIGRIAENAVCAELVAHQYRICCRNYLLPRLGELDIVAERQERLLFVEVKGRVGDGFGGPFAALTAAKRKRLRKTAEHYLQRHLEMHNDIIFLAAAVWLDSQGTVRKIRYEPIEFA